MRPAGKLPVENVERGHSAFPLDFMMDCGCFLLRYFNFAMI